MVVNKMPFKTVRIEPTVRPRSLNGLKVCSHNESKLLILWYKFSAVIFHMTYPVEKLTNCYGVLQFRDELRDVILTKSTIICLSRGGIMYAADLQESFRKKGKEIDHKELHFVKNVMSINVTSDGFLVVTQKGELMAFGISRLENGKSKISLKMMQNVPGQIGQVHKSICAIAFRSTDVQSSLASLLFKDIVLLKCDIAFLGLDNGDVYWLPLVDSKVDSNFNLMHHSNSAIIDFALVSDGKAKQINQILILSSSGSVAVIGQMENQLTCRVHHLPGSIQCANLASPNIIFHSDGLNLWRSEINSENVTSVTFNTQLLPIKGVVALTYESRTHEMIVGCRHCILYKMEPYSPIMPLDSDTLASRSETFGDIGSLMHEWQYATQELNTLRERIAMENKVLGEISTAVRGKLLRNVIKLKAEVNDDFPFALRNNLALKVINESSQEFSNEFWLFHTQVNSGDWNVNVTEKLECSLKPSNAMIFIVPINAVDLKFPVTVDCSLVLSVPMGDFGSSGEVGHQFHEIPLKHVSLDVTDFLTPVLEDFTVNHQSLLLEEVTWDQFLARYKHVSPVQDVAIRKREAQPLHCYSFKLPETESWAEFKDRIVKKSEHRLHDNVKTSNKLKFRIRNNMITFSCPSDNQTVTIIASNKHLLSEIQAFIVNKVLSKNNESDKTAGICVDEINYLKFRNVNLALELEIEKGASWKNLSTLKQELRNLFHLNIPDWEKL